MNVRGVSISILVHLLEFSTVVIGGVFALIAWCSAVVKWFRGTRPGLSLLAFTAVVISGAATGFIEEIIHEPLWIRVTDDLWKILFWSCLALSFVLLIGSVIQSWKKPTIVKPFSIVLLIINAPLFVWLALTLAGIAD